MTPDDLTDDLLRRFLLGEVSEDEREQIKSLLITDSAAMQKVAIAHEDLIDDYVDGSLFGAGRQLFEERYASSKESLLMLRITRRLREIAKEEGS